MVEYARKYNSKHKMRNREWKTVHPPFTITPMDWKVFDFRFNGVVYTSPTLEFKNALSKEVMWRNLNDTI